MPLGFLGNQGDSDTYRIERSLRFNDDDAAYLSRTFGTPTDGKKCTLSLWYKRGNLGGSLSSYGGVVFAASGTNFFSIADNTPSGSDELMLWYGNARTLTSTAKFRDPTAWYHLVIAFDSTQATAANRCKVYINGSEVTSWSTDARSNITLNSTITFNTASISALISGYVAGGVGQYDGYLAEYHFVDGQSLTPSSFGETDAITGRWKAKAYSGTYGTNGFYLKFADNSGATATTLGKDSSGNGNNWTVNNFSVTAGAGNDSLVDSPTNYGTDTGIGGEVRGNYATLNPLATTGGTLLNGNLEYNGASAWKASPSTFLIPSSGKWYWEGTLIVGPAGATFGGAYGGIGVIAPSAVSAWSYNSATSCYLTDTGHISNYNSGSTTSFTGNTLGTVIGLAFDRSANTLAFYQNNTLKSTQTVGISSGSDLYAFVANYNSSYGVFAVNFGQRPFAYTAPSGFKALCTQNLNQPTIQKPSTAMDVVTYTGTGASQSISSLGFSPDLVWIKGRSGATDHAIYDTTRGVQKDLGSNLTTDETTQSQGITSFDSAGFTIGTLAKLNTSTSTYVAWCWDESAMDGVDIVSYTGNGANRTISHNLGVAPKMIIVKARTTAGADQGWPVYHASLANTEYLLLNSTAAKATGTDYWNSTSPTASVFSLGTNAAVNTNNDTYIAYAFSEVDGFSKFGRYTGNGSADGPFVWCGFRPRWVMSKSATGAYNWHLYDSARDTSNACTNDILPNSSGAEVTGSTYIDILSNGFKVRASDIGFNGSGATFIFAAFAESPFKYARAR